MHPLRHSVVAALLGGAAASTLAFLLDHLHVDPRITLGVSLATFTVIDRIVLEARRSHRCRALLRENLVTFFDNMYARAKTAPLWTELKRQMDELHSVESAPQRRELLRAALAEATRLSDQTSFLAITLRDTPLMMKLKESLE